MGIHLSGRAHANGLSTQASGSGRARGHASLSDPAVVAIVQARMGSARLPGKTLADIEGQPLLARIIERVKASHTVHSIVVATTTLDADRVIADLALKCGIEAYTGSPEDVLDRYYQAAKWSDAGVVVRVTADDPFKDPEVLDHIVEYLLSYPELDYATNTIQPTYPEGLDVEAFTFPALERAWREARLRSEREHVTPYIWKHPDRFRIANITHSEDLSYLRWTLDYEADLRFTREVYKRLQHKGVFLMADILSLLQSEPTLVQINAGFDRNSGYAGSVRREQS